MSSQHTPRLGRDIATKFSEKYSRENKPVELKDRVCRERLERLFDKYKADDAKALNKFVEEFSLLVYTYAFVLNIVEERKERRKKAALPAMELKERRTILALLKKSDMIIYYNNFNSMNADMVIYLCELLLYKLAVLTP